MKDPHDLYKREVEDAMIEKSEVDSLKARVAELEQQLAQAQEELSEWRKLEDEQAVLLNILHGKLKLKRRTEKMPYSRHITASLR